MERSGLNTRTEKGAGNKRECNPYGATHTVPLLTCTLANALVCAPVIVYVSARKVRRRGYRQLHPR